MSDQDVRTEVARGARFVVFSWNISAVVLSFKRASDIYFVRPGQNLFWPPYLYTLVSWTIGLCGFPWGIIFAIQTLCTNGAGGSDVTSQLYPRYANLRLPPPLPGEPPPLAEPVMAPTAERARGNRLAPFAAVATVILSIALLIAIAAS